MIFLAKKYGETDEEFFARMYGLEVQKNLKLKDLLGDILIELRKNDENSVKIVVEKIEKEFE